MNTRSGKNKALKEQSDISREENMEDPQHQLMQNMFSMLTSINYKMEVMDTRLIELEQSNHRAAELELSVSENPPKNRDSAETSRSSPVEARKQNTSPAQYDHSFFTAPSSPERFSTPTSVKLTHATVPGQVTIIRGTTTDYNKKLL
jgi:hypothetical protein